jgi:hypothetical protein
MTTAPDYVGFEPRARDELLSQIGGFAPTERDLFQRLCDMWAPRIDARHVVSTGEASPEQVLAALERLMSKLRTAQIGFLTHIETESGPTPEHVVLTSRGSLVFWAHVTGEAVARLARKGFQMLPSEERLKAAHALPPDYHCFESSSSQLVQAYAGTVTEPTIFRLRLLDKYQIIYTNDTAHQLVNRAIAVLRRDIMERGLVDELARLADTSITEMRGRLDSKAPDVWLDLARTVVQERATIAWRKTFEESDEIFQLAYLVMIYVDAKIGAAKEQQESEAVVQEEIETIGNMVMQASGGMMEDDAFAALVGEAQERLGSQAGLLVKKLNDELLTPRSRRRLPTVVLLHEKYIHSVRVRSVFETARLESSRALTAEYTDIMEAYLRGRTAEIGEVFNSRDLLNEDIASRIRRGYPLLAALIARPQLLAEAIILDAKQKREGMSPEDLKAVLAAYFDVTSSQLLPLNQLLGIDIVAIFDDAYSNTSVFRQLFLRLSGRHESLRANYVRRFGPRRSRKRMDAESAPPAGARSGSPGPGDQSGTRTRGTGNRSHKPETIKRDRPQRISATPSRPRAKSPREIDQVWEEFSQAIHTKPSKEDPS